MKKLNPNTKYDIIVALSCIVLTVLVIFEWSTIGINSSADKIGGKEQITIESYEIPEEVDLKLIGVHKVISKDGTEYNEAEFNLMDGLDKEVIKCLIPIDKSGDFEIGTIYKANVSYWYIKETYENAYKEYKKYDSIQDAVRENKLENYRQIKNVDFLYSEYVTNTVTEKEMTELFANESSENKKGK